MQDRLARAGGLISSSAALLASSCCGLPVALSLLGVGSGTVGLLGPLQPWRGVLLAVSAGLLAAGWAFTLRRRARALREHACPRGRFRSNFAVLGFSTLLLAVAAAAPLWDLPLARGVMDQAR